MDDRSALLSSCEICGTGLCAEAQADGVPCVGASTLCVDCAKGLATLRYRRINAPAEERETDLLDRAGL